MIKKYFHCINISNIINLCIDQTCCNKKTSYNFFGGNAFVKTIIDLISLKFRIHGLTSCQGYISCRVILEVYLVLIFNSVRITKVSETVAWI